MEDLVGKQFGEWKVIKYAGNRYWECKCSCNKIQLVHGYKLTSGLSKSCGHSKNKFIDLKDQVFGDWTVEKYIGDHKWQCRCSCGNIGIVESKTLRDGKSTSCGHNTTGFKDLTNRRFGKWTALKHVGNSLWECKCDCGSIGKVKTYDLLNGKSKSCGCETTKFIDLTDKVYGDWHVDFYLGNQNWMCTCICGTQSIVNGQKLRSGLSKSCGCNKLKHIIETNRINYGVDYNGQQHRSPQQVAMTSSRDNLYATILSNFTDRPSPRELGEIVGLTEHRVMIIVRHFGLEDYICLNKAVSQYEDEIYNMFPGGIRSDRSVLKGKELDIYYPDCKLAIEFNGTYWNSDLFKDKKYHQNKTVECAKLGIQLIHIFEYEWKDDEKRNKLITLLSNKINGNKDVVYARNIVIKHIEEAEYRQFLNNNHIQGYAPASIKLGAFRTETEELIGVMSFGKPRFNTEYQYELIRFVWKSGLTVVGGAEKMFKFFITEFNPDSVLTYSDISKFTGNIYSRLGFKSLCLTEPNYVWVNTFNDTVLSRYQTMRHKLLEIGLGDESMSESEIMQEAGFLKIYDCGNIKLEWIKP